jgi:hypothetical protein
LAESAPVEPEEVEAVIDETSEQNSTEQQGGEFQEPAAFENIETGVLEHDLATHKAALLEESKEGETLDLGRVEGLSAGPSTLRDLVVSDENAEEAESDTIKKSE